MGNYLRTPKAQLALTLLAIYVSTLIHQFSLSIILLFLEALFFAVTVDLLLFYIRNKKLFVPYAGIVSGLIISLTLEPGTPIWGILLVCAIAMATKHFIRISNKHIFNPAATGLVLGGIILREPVSWWGSSFQTITDGKLSSYILFLVLLLPLLVSGYRMRRHFSIISFFVVYAIGSFFLLATHSFTTWLPIILSPSLIFFTIVMLPEPMTSPVNRKRQILYGVLVAILALILILPTISTILAPIGLLPDPFLMALLIGNAAFFKFK